MDNNFKVSLYIRVSTDKQTEGESLEEQESELKKFCEYKKYLIHKTHIERGRSAKDTKRPEYQKLIADIKDKKINAVIVKKLDRLSRSLLDFEEFMRIAQEFNVEFISLRENFDTTNAIGKAMLRVALVFAQLEREQTAERISDVMHYRASQGLYNGGGVPFGYDLINKGIFVNKQEKKIVEFVFNRFIETQSIADVVREVNILGYRTKTGIFWDDRKIDKILRRPVYAGKTQWGKKIYQGTHLPIVSENTFNIVQKIFTDRKHIQSKSKIGGILNGFLYCGYCSSPITPNYAKKKSGKKYYYYRCTSSLSHNRHKKFSCKSKYYVMAQVEQNVFKQIIEFASPENINKIKQTIDINNVEIKKELKQAQELLNSLDLKLENIKSKKEKYLDSLISNSFTVKERKTINEKIEEFSIEEKHVQANIYQCQLDISNKNSSLVSIDEFKEQLIAFKINYQLMSEKDIKIWLNKNIENISYTNEKIDIDFKLLKI